MAGALVVSGEQHNSLENLKTPIFQTHMGIDILRCNGWHQPDISLLEAAAYDYVIVNPVSEQECLLVINSVDHVIVCTDLEHANELKEFQTLEKQLRASKSAISLIVPNKINTKEWDKNSRQLFALAEYFGFEMIADPIPHCERIHDLPLGGQTVWSIKQENIKDAFNRLLEVVDNI